jgi:excinuclease ABC subunit C
LGRISLKEYHKTVDRARWFFGGQKQKIIADWKKEMKGFSKRMNYEEAAAVRDRIETLEHMDERVTFGEVTQEMLEQRVGESRSVQELMRALHLKKPPESIECFDISHIQGVEKVGSMVRFDHGRATKSQYRKFIIRTVEGIDDFKSMAEVVGRRYRRLKAEGKAFPDLVLIDGGKGQLSAALGALAKEDLMGIEVAALAKQEEEVFRPGSSESIRLPDDSAGLLLLRQIRDEAHRFAITFHRLRRGKRSLRGEGYAQ